jgi:hypothetical protein
MVAGVNDRQRICESSNCLCRPYVGSFDIEPDSFRATVQELPIAEQVKGGKLQLFPMQPGGEGDVRPDTCGFA